MSSHLQFLDFSFAMQFTGGSDKVAVNIDAVYMAHFVNVKQTWMNVLYTAL